jgi:hypothetical protein
MKKQKDIDTHCESSLWTSHYSVDALSPATFKREKEAMLKMDHFEQLTVPDDVLKSTKLKLIADRKSYIQTKEVRITITGRSIQI